MIYLRNVVFQCFWCKFWIEVRRAPISLSGMIYPPEDWVLQLWGMSRELFCPDCRDYKMTKESKNSREAPLP